MDGSVVELDALTDTDRTGTEYDDRLFVALSLGDELLRLVFLIKGGIEVRRFGGKLSRAGVDHLVDRGTRIIDLAAGQLGDGLVEEAGLFGGEIELVGQIAFFELFGDVDDVLHLVEEPLVDHGDIVDLLNGNAALEGFVDAEDPSVVADAQTVGDRGVGELLEFLVVEGVVGDLSAADSLHDRLLKGRRDRHDLAGRFHLGAELALGVNEFIEGPLRELDDHVVDRRLKAGVGGTRYGVLDLVEVVADGDLCRHLGDGIAGRLGSEG